MEIKKCHHGLNQYLFKAYLFAYLEFLFHTGGFQIKSKLKEVEERQAKSRK
jgi:hypothetical protein